MKTHSLRCAVNETRSDGTCSWCEMDGPPAPAAPRPNLEDLYVALEAAIAATADLVALAQALLPDEVSLPSFVALSELCRLKLAVNPGPTEEDPF